MIRRLSAELTAGNADERTCTSCWGEDCANKFMIFIFEQRVGTVFAEIRIEHFLKR